MADITLGIGAEASQARAVISQLAASIDALSATLAKAFALKIDTSQATAALNNVSATAKGSVDSFAKAAKSSQDKVTEAFTPRLRDGNGKFVKAGNDAGDAFANGINKGAGKVDGSGFAAKLKDSFKVGNISDALIGGITGGGTVAIAEKLVGGLVQGFQAAIDLGQEFETGMQSLQAVTGVSGAGLTDLGDRARALALKFGGSASEQIGVFQTTLSKIGPQLAQDAGALGTFADNVNTLSKTDSALGAAGAVDALTGSLLQFGVDVNDSNAVAQESSRFINVLAASAAVGSASVSQVSESVAVVGATAKNANISFEETNAALQVLASKSLVGSQAGTGLATVLNKLQAQSKDGDDALKKLGTSSARLGELLNTKGIGAAVDELRTSMSKLGSQAEKNALLNKLFGEGGQNAAAALLGGGEMLKQFTEGVTGTNAATEQAAINMNTLGERMSRVKAAIEDKLISVFQAVAPVINEVIDGITTGFNIISEVVGPIFAQLSETLGKTFSAIGAIIKPILAVIGASIISNLVTAMSIFGTVVNTVYDIVNRVFDGIVRALKPVVDAFKKAFGISDEVGKGIDFIKLFQDALQIMSTVISEVGGVVAELGGFLVDLLLTPLQFIGNAIAEVVNFFGSFNKEQKDVKKNAEASVPILTQIKTAFGNIKGTIGGLTESFHVLKDVIFEFFSKLRSLDIKGALAQFTDLGSKLKTAYDEGFNRANPKIDAEAEAAAKAQEAAQEQIRAGQEQTAKEDEKNKKTALQLRQEEVKRLQQIAKTEADNFALSLKEAAVAEGRKLTKDDELTILRKRAELLDGVLVKAKELLGVTLDENGRVVTTTIKLQAEDGGVAKVRADLDAQLLALREEPVNVRLDILSKDGQLPEDQLKDIQDNIKKSFAALKDSTAAFTNGTIDRNAFDQAGNTLRESIALNIDRAQTLLKSDVIQKNLELKTLFTKAVEDFGISQTEFEAQFAEAIRTIQDKSIKTIVEQNKRKIELLKEDETANSAAIRELLLQNVELETNLKLGQIEVTGDARIAETNLVLREAEKQVQGITQRYKDAPSALEEATQSITDVILKAFTPPTVNEQARAALRQQEEDLQKSLAQREIDYAQYQAKLSELDAQRTQDSTFFTRLVEGANAAASTKLTSLAAENYKEFNDSVNATTETSSDRIKAVTDNIGTLAQGAGEQFGALVLSGANASQALAQVAIENAKMLVKTLIPALFANYLTFIPPPFNLAAAGIAVALINGLLSGIGAEDGVIGITRDYQRPRGRTDKIPIWTAKGESIINEQATTRNRGILEFINKGGDWQTYAANNITREKLENDLALSKMGIVFAAIAEQGAQAAMFVQERDEARKDNEMLRKEVAVLHKQIALQGEQTREVLNKVAAVFESRSAVDLNVTSDTDYLQFKMQQAQIKALS